MLLCCARHFYYFEMLLEILGRLTTSAYHVGSAHEEYMSSNIVTGNAKVVLKSLCYYCVGTNYEQIAQWNKKSPVVFDKQSVFYRS